MATAQTPAHLLLFGRPGSGKSSLAERLSTNHGFVLVRTGEMLRAAVRRGDPLGARAGSFLQAGTLAPDAIIAEMLEQSLKAPGSDRLLFDGFPRTLGQVAILENLERTFQFEVDCCLEIALDRDEAVARMSGRRVCPVCGATYHVVNQPPKVAETCDHDGARLERRKDDAPEVIQVRQEAYEQYALPILAHYHEVAPDRCRSVDGAQPLDDVYHATCLELGLTPLPAS